MTTHNSVLPEQVLQVCHKNLLAKRTELLNRIGANSLALRWKTPSGGDEVDQSSDLLLEDQLIFEGRRLQQQLFEINSALARIEQGIYGICEETHEPIEIERILALPATRFSIEGAEIRESNETITRRAT
jgi:DnaK suppressor protein